MRTYPKDEDKKELEVLNAEQWQIDLLKMNPEYVYWGCYEDYMSKEGSGWDSRVITDTWKNHEWELDELNECVNFYFEIYRKSHNCPHCEGAGLNEATKRLLDDWYDFNETGRKWCHKLTEVEIEALVKGGRIKDVSGFVGYYDDEKQVWMKWDGKEKVECERPEMPTPEQVNAWEQGSRGFGHDSINKWICVKARAEHLGVYGSCEHCQDGQVYDEPKAKAALQLWYLHPRKGCSRGVYIEEITKEDLPEVIKYLQEAAQRNADRFSNLIAI
jgi:hypothetical protein